MTNYTSNNNLRVAHILNNKNTLDFKNVFKLTLGGLVCIFVGLTPILSFPVYLFRFFVIFLAKLFRSDLDDILNGLSSLLANDYFYNSKSPRASLIISVVTEGHDLTIEQLKQMLIDRWVLAKDSATGNLKFKQFQQYPVRWMGFTFWKKYTFNIDNHVYQHDQINNKREYVDENDVNNICEMLLNKPYCPFNSPWEVHLVKNYRTENTTKCVLIIKVHHSLADGYSMLSAVVEGLMQHNISKSELPVPQFKKRSILEKIIYYISLPVNALYEFSYAFSKIFEASPWKIPDEKKDWYQVCAKSDYIPIEKVKFIKNQLNVTFTSVLLSAISSGIECSMKDLKMKKPNGEIESSVYCMSTLPIADHPKGLTNYTTATLLDLPFAKHDNSVERLQNTNLMLETSKHSCIPFIIPFYFSVMGCHLYPVAKFFGKMRMTQMGLSNFPTVPIQTETNGVKFIAGDFLAGGLDGSIGVLVTVSSSNGLIRVGVTAERAVMSKEEVNKFAVYVMKEIDRLYDIASLRKKENTHVLK